MLEAVWNHRQWYVKILWCHMMCGQTHWHTEHLLDYQKNLLHFLVLCLWLLQRKQHALLFVLLLLTMLLQPKHTHWWKREKAWSVVNIRSNNVHCHILTYQKQPIDKKITHWWGYYKRSWEGFMSTSSTCDPLTGVVGWHALWVVSYDPICMYVVCVGLSSC